MINFQKKCQTLFQQIIKYIIMIHDMQMTVTFHVNQRHLANTYILLTKREGRTGRISARGLDSTYKKDQGPIFSQYVPEQAWLIRDILHD